MLEFNQNSLYLAPPAGGLAHGQRVAHRAALEVARVGVRVLLVLLLNRCREYFLGGE